MYKIKKDYEIRSSIGKTIHVNLDFPTVSLAAILNNVIICFCAVKVCYPARRGPQDPTGHA